VRCGHLLERRQLARVLAVRRRLLQRLAERNVVLVLPGRNHLIFPWLIYV